MTTWTLVAVKSFATTRPLTLILSPEERGRGNRIPSPLSCKGEGQGEGFAQPPPHVGGYKDFSQTPDNLYGIIGNYLYNRRTQLPPSRNLRRWYEGM